MLGKLPFHQNSSTTFGASRLSLGQRFAQSLDQSALEEWVGYLMRGCQPARAQLLGVGTHFESYLLVTGSSLDLVISLAHSGFWGRQPEQRRQWGQLVQKARTLDHPLIPPMWLIQDDETLAYITPYAPQEPEQLAAEVQNGLEDLCVSLASCLQANDLYLDDVWQIRGIDHHPLVIDWSDLKSLK